MTLSSAHKGFPVQLQPESHQESNVGSGGRNWSPTRTVTGDTIPDVVLLEIFDLYRQSFGDELSSEKVWNNKNGWFKLAHVCRNWRRVVLASPSRLRLRLFFTDITPTRAVVLRCLSHLPIIIDYSNVTWNASTRKRLLSALRYSDRVCRIAIMGSEEIPGNIHRALNLPFPALESLELHYMEPDTLFTHFMTSIRSLRHLRSVNGRLSSLLPLLSVTRTLVDLDLAIDSVFYRTNRASLLTHLQHMPHLRSLQVSTRGYSIEEEEEEEEESPPASVFLAELTCFRFFGDCAEIEWFVAGLVIPSLRELHIAGTGTLTTPYLSQFLRVAGIHFFAARLTNSEQSITTSLFEHHHSIDDPPSKIVTIKTPFETHPSSAPSLMLATLQDVFLSSSISAALYGPALVYLATWRKFFEEFRNVKVLRLQHRVAAGVVDVLRQPTMDGLPPQEVDLDTTTPLGTPINSIRNQFNLDILPSLEEIVVYPKPGTLIGEEERMFGLRDFGPFETARHQVGRPVKVSWGTFKELPRYFVT